MWNHLLFTKDLTAGAFGWAQAARIRQSLIEVPDSTEFFIHKTLEEQSQRRVEYPLDAADRRHTVDRTVVRTEGGEVVVEVPEREEIETPASDPVSEIRASHAIQAKIARLGALSGYTVWLPPGDRQKILDITPSPHRDQFVTTLPLNGTISRPFEPLRILT